MYTCDCEHNWVKPVVDWGPLDWDVDAIVLEEHGGGMLESNRKLSCK